MSDFHRFTMTDGNGSDEPAALLDFLRSAMPGPVIVDVGAIGQIDTLRMQVLTSAARQFEAAGTSLVLAGMSDEFRAGMQRLGLAPEHFEGEVAA